jgi:hypothetical protein
VVSGTEGPNRKRKEDHHHVHPDHHPHRSHHQVDRLDRHHRRRRRPRPRRHRGRIAIRLRRTGTRQQGQRLGSQQFLGWRQQQPLQAKSSGSASTPLRDDQAPQEQLGQLNYYNGPVTGYMNHDTVQAIMYLQRDAHLPQTGQLNTATENALNSMLAGGNNQMGGNTNNNQMNANN